MFTGYWFGSAMSMYRKLSLENAAKAGARTLERLINEGVNIAEALQPPLNDAEALPETRPYEDDDPSGLKRPDMAHGDGVQTTNVDVVPEAPPSKDPPTRDGSQDDPNDPVPLNFDFIDASVTVSHCRKKPEADASVDVLVEQALPASKKKMKSKDQVGGSIEASNTSDPLCSHGMRSLVGDEEVIEEEAMRPLDVQQRRMYHFLEKVSSNKF